MYVLEDVAAIVEIAKAWLFPLSVVFFFAIYPLGLLISVLMDGRAAKRASTLASTQQAQKSGEHSWKVPPKSTSQAISSTRLSQTVKVATVLVVCVSLGFICSLDSFVLGPVSRDAGTLDAASQVGHARRLQEIQTVSDKATQDSSSQSFGEVEASLALHPTAFVASPRAVARMLPPPVVVGHIADHTSGGIISHPVISNMEEDTKHRAALIESDAGKETSFDSSEDTEPSPDVRTNSAAGGPLHAWIFDSFNLLIVVGVIIFVVCAGMFAAWRATRGAREMKNILQHPRRTSQTSMSARRDAVLRRGSECQMVCSEIETHAFPPLGVRKFEAPKATELGSLWHNVNLHARDHFGKETGIYRYINEIPFGALQKFEMHTKKPQNVITEHQSGSKKLQAFGVPVPFNYGCFPQTIRDPEKIDEISGVGGDDDPTDVIDLTGALVDPGAVVRCRPLGAVCLIDEGQADWKILVVNVDVESALSHARSVADVERMAPGRIDEALKWLDDFKKHSTVDSKLHFEIHDARCAVNIIERDHMSYRGLVKEVDATGYARGHWIGPVVPTDLEQFERHLGSLVSTELPDTIFMETMPAARSDRLSPIQRKAFRQYSDSEASDASSGASNGVCEQELA
mmetsp:Transcript_15624/g.25369  ORF Transcript_15624/g.25369 Transcript_15624/m.25369 type:complete len:629 (+) Transcript_15624:65-1951(+)